METWLRRKNAQHDTKESIFNPKNAKQFLNKQSWFSLICTRSNRFFRNVSPNTKYKDIYSLLLQNKKQKPVRGFYFWKDLRAGTTRDLAHGDRGQRDTLIHHGSALVVMALFWGVVYAALLHHHFT